MRCINLLLAVGALLMGEPSGHARVSPLRASLTCQRALGPGRVLCELTAEASPGKLVWSDALVVRAPNFARPLRSRFLAQLGAGGIAGAAWAKLALVASSPGQGRLELLARGVICQDFPAGESCRAATAHVSATVEVAEPARAP